jgi:hypothetical protein
MHIPRLLQTLVTVWIAEDYTGADQSQIELTCNQIVFKLSRLVCLALVWD